MLKLKSYSAWVLALAVWPGPGQLLACGPWFPNGLLVNGGNGLLVAPEATFAREIQTLNRAAPIFHAVCGTNGFGSEAAEADLGELRTALEREGRSAANIERIVRQHEAERSVLRRHAGQWDTWQETRSAWPPGPTNPPPFLSEDAAHVTAGLPGEFADYFRGAIAWHCGKTNEAHSAWQALLQRAPAERRFRSTWAAFMLGKAVWETEPSHAVKYFQQVRSLATGGFADSLGLAASSLGWEARVELRRKNYARAIDLYLEQAATGDDTACNSLRFAAALALRDGATLRSLAADPRAQGVITDYLISGGWVEPPVDVDGAVLEPVVQLLSKQTYIGPPTNGWHKMKAPALLWLEAVETAKVRDVESAEKLALAAYQSGEMAVAWRWIARAPDSPTAQWLKAKLLLRDGQIEQAAVLLSKLSRRFPQGDNVATNEPGGTALQERLYTPRSEPRVVPANTQVLGELGALHLARREYAEALDALLRADFWMDAAFVAERVLTAEELRSYVDRSWPAASQAHVTAGGDASPATHRERIRFLLARRLTRESRGVQAREYYPAEWLSVFDKLATALRSGRDVSLPIGQRAGALFTAAKITRTNGMELVGTEVEPDWHIHDGNYQDGVTVRDRANSSHRILPASQDELRRALEHHADPEARFHYRYQAAALGWEAAKLMPDNSEETALVLCLSGSWLKRSDAKAADLFYKELVRRCPKTVIGSEANRIRWFPDLDGKTP